MKMPVAKLKMASTLLLGSNAKIADNGTILKILMVEICSMAWRATSTAAFPPLLSQRVTSPDSATAVAKILLSNRSNVAGP